MACNQIVGFQEDIRLIGHCDGTGPNKRPSSDKRNFTVYVLFTISVLFLMLVVGRIPN